MDVLGLDEKSARHHVESAEATYLKIQQRLAATESDDEEADTPEFIAMTQSIYKGYLQQRKFAIEDTNEYLQTTFSFNVDYKLAQRMMRLGEIGELGQISAKAELASAKTTLNVLTSNVNSLDNMITTAKYSGYAGNTLLFATGVGAFANGGRMLATYFGSKVIGWTAMTAIAGTSGYAINEGITAIENNVSKENRAYVQPVATITLAAIGGFAPRLAKMYSAWKAARASQLVSVISYADKGITADLAAGRWVVLGSKNTWLTRFKTGLWGSDFKRFFWPWAKPSKTNWAEPKIGEVRRDQLGWPTSETEPWYMPPFNYFMGQKVLKK